MLTSLTCCLPSWGVVLALTRHTYSLPQARWATRSRCTRRWRAPAEGVNCTLTSATCAATRPSARHTFCATYAATRASGLSCAFTAIAPSCISTTWTDIVRLPIHCTNNELWHQRQNASCIRKCKPTGQFILQQCLNLSHLVCGDGKLSAELWYRKQHVKRWDALLNINYAQVSLLKCWLYQHSL